MLLREKARVQETQRLLTVQAAAELLVHRRHGLVRDADESKSEHASCAALFQALLDHARRA